MKSSVLDHLQEEPSHKHFEPKVVPIKMLKPKFYTLLDSLLMQTGIKRAIKRSVALRYCGYFDHFKLAEITMEAQSIYAFC
jgi:hypothetical protein